MNMGEKNLHLLYVDNVASHYREAIFLLMDNAFDVHYLFGESLDDIKQMDTSSLRGEVEKSKNYKVFGGWYWQKGVVSKIWRNFDKYVLIGDTRALSTWVFALIAYLSGKSRNVYFWTHGWYGKETWLESYVKKVYFRLAKGGIFLYGNYARNLMIEEGFKPEKLYTIHNSLDYNRQIQIRQSLRPMAIYKDRFSNNHKNLIFIGRLTPVKKLDLILYSLRICADKGHNYNLTFVGDGEKRRYLESLSEKLGLHDKVWFYGSCYDEEENAKLIFNADLCVSPGNIGLTAIHSMVYGTPVITHDSFSYQMPEFEVIHKGKTGDFFAYNDVTSLANSLISWFEHHPNRQTTRTACYKEIDESWTPSYQLNVLNSVLLKDN